MRYYQDVQHCCDLLFFLKLVVNSENSSYLDCLVFLLT